MRRLFRSKKNQINYLFLLHTKLIYKLYIHHNRAVNSGMYILYNHLTYLLLFEISCPLIFKGLHSSYICLSALLSLFFFEPLPFTEAMPPTPTKCSFDLYSYQPIFLSASEKNICLQTFDSYSFLPQVLFSRRLMTFV